MRKKTFGHTGLELSALGFGCMRLPLTNPDDLGSIDYDLATAMVRKAIDNGVNYIDTAWPYHSSSGRNDAGQSEPFVGRALKGGYREKVSLATKLPCWLIKSRADMDRILDEQLKRLDVGCIDFYLAHNLNDIVWPQIRDMGLFEFFDAAIKDGRIKYAGFSFHDIYSRFEEILKSYDWTFTQIQYNYLDVDYQAGQRGLKLAAERGLGVVIMEPLRGGFLINNIPEKMKNLLASVRPEWSLADWGLRWLFNQPEVGLVLSGMSEMAHVDDNLRIASAEPDMGEKEIAALDQVREYFKSRLKVNCTACGYCLPCPAGVNIPKNFMYFNDYFLTDDEVVRGRSKYFFSAQVAENETFKNCIHCRECEDKCPQSLPISDSLEEMSGVFGG